MSLKVVFDVGEFGSHSQVGFRGVRRVAENLARGLADDPRIDLQLAGISAHDAGRVTAVLGENSSRIVHFSHRIPFVDEAGKFVRRAAGSSAIHKLVHFGIPRVLGNLAQTVENFSRRVSFLRGHDAQIFHSPFRPLPQSSRRVDFPTPFLTVYDIIPLLQPRLVAPLSRAQVQTIVRSIHSRAWLTCISQAVKNDICNYLGFPSERTFVTPLAAAPETFRPADPEEAREVRKRYGIADSPYILTLCEIEPRKNLEHLVDTVLFMLREHPMRDLQLVFVGKYLAQSPAFRALRAKVAGLGKRTIFTGFVPDSDLAGLYAGAAAFAFPSLAEGFGLPPLEAMQCGVPVVCSNTTSLPEVVGEAGFLLDPKDQEAWSDALHQLLTSETLRQTFRVRSLERARLFTWEKTLRELIFAYEFALAYNS